MSYAVFVVVIVVVVVVVVVVLVVVVAAAAVAAVAAAVLLLVVVASFAGVGFVPPGGHGREAPDDLRGENLRQRQRRGQH